MIQYGNQECDIERMRKTEGTADENGIMHNECITLPVSGRRASLLTHRVI